MHDPIIKRSYKRIFILLIITGAPIPIYFILLLQFSILGSLTPVLILFFYMILWLFLVLSQYNKFDIFYGIYREWMKQDEAGKMAFSELTFSKICHLTDFKKERERMVRPGGISEGFDLVQSGSLGCIFYTNEKVSTYTYVIVCGKLDLITIPLMFTNSISPKHSSFNTGHIKELFLNWASENGYRVRHLLLFKRGVPYDPEKQNR